MVNIINDRNEETLHTQFLTILDSPNHIDRNQESWCLGDFNQDSIFSHQLELDQSQTFDELASFHFKEIEPYCECETDPQLCDSVSVFEWMLTLASLPDLNLFFKPTPIHVPELEIEQLIFDSHIPLIKKECEFQFFDLELTLE